MLFGAVSVLVVVASGEPGDGSTRAIEEALRTAILRDATVAVKAASKAASDDELTSLAVAEHAEMLCVVTWSDHLRRVVVRFTKVPSDHWNQRELRFEPVDAANERGRTIGFALASMMPDEVFADAAPPKATEPPAPARAAVPEPPALSFEDRPIAERSPLKPLPRANPLAVDAVAITALAPDGYGGGVGGMFSVRVPLTGALGFHGGIGARAGSIDPAAASSHTVIGAAGLAWQPWLDARHRWAAGARLDALVVFLDVDHLDADDTEAKHLSRFMPGTSALAEGTWRFADQAAIVAGAGTEIVFGRTDLFLHEQKVGTVPATKLVAELGLRVSFP